MAHAQWAESVPGGLRYLPVQPELAGKLFHQGWAGRKVPRSGQPVGQEEGCEGARRVTGLRVRCPVLRETKNVSFSDSDLQDIVNTEVSGALTPRTPPPSFFCKF